MASEIALAALYLLGAVMVWWVADSGAEWTHDEARWVGALWPLFAVVVCYALCADKWAAILRRLKKESSDAK